MLQFVTLIIVFLQAKCKVFITCQPRMNHVLAVTCHTQTTHLLRGYGPV